MELKEIEIQFTTDCNLNCNYCGNYATCKQESITVTKEFLSPIIEHSNIHFLKIGGGEPLLHFEELLDIIQYCSSRDLQIQLDTNGTLIDMYKALELYRAGLDRCRVSINSLDFETFHLTRRGNRKQFLTSLQACRMLSQAGIEVVVDTVVTTENREQISAINQWCADQGVVEHWIECGEPAGRAPWNILLKPIELVEFLKNLFVESNRMVKLVVHCCQATPCGPFKDLYDSIPSNVKFDPCILENGRLHIDAQGDIYICDIGNLGNSIGNIYKDDINKVALLLDEILSYRKEYLSECKSKHPGSICKNWCGIPFALDDGPHSVWEQYDIHITNARQASDPFKYTEEWREKLRNLEETLIRHL